jgi:hypothetical protein
MKRFFDIMVSTSNELVVEDIKDKLEMIKFINFSEKYKDNPSYRKQYNMCGNYPHSTSCSKTDTIIFECDREKCEIKIKNFKKLIQKTTLDGDELIEVVDNYNSPSEEELANSLFDYFTFFKSKQIFDFLTCPKYPIQKKKELTFEIGDKEENCWVYLFRYNRRSYWSNKPETHDDVTSQIIKKCSITDDVMSEECKNMYDKIFNKQIVKCILLTHLFYLLEKIEINSDKKSTDALTEDIQYLNNQHQNPIIGELYKKYILSKNKANVSKAVYENEKNKYDELQKYYKNLIKEYDLSISYYQQEVNNPSFNIEI